MRHAGGDARGGDVERCELALEQQRSRLSIHARRSRHDDFFDAVVPNPRDELPDGQVVGANALEGREESSEHEVAPAHRSRALDGDEVVNARDDAEYLGVALGVAAYVADRVPIEHLGDVAAPLAGAKLVA